MVLDFPELADRLERAHSRRLALRPVSLSDAWPLFQATRNPLFNKHLLWDRPDDEQAVLQRIDAIVDAARRGRMTALSGVLKTTGEWTALFRFQPYGSEPAAMEMGVWVHDRFWHGRYSLELGRLCVDAAFDSCEVKKLVGASAPENRGSCHLMRSVGMSPASLVTRSTESGQPVVLQEFALLRADWVAQKKEAGEAGSYASVPKGAARIAAAPQPRSWQDREDMAA